MKLMIAILLFFTMQASALGHAQNITIVKRNISLAEVFKSIEKQTGFLFFYDKQMIQNAAPIDIAIKDATLEQALAICFRDQRFTYTIVKNTIVIQEKTMLTHASYTNPEPVAAILADISGKVVDEEGNPLEGASIKLKGSDRATTADANGNFSIQGAPDGAVVLIVSYVGYTTLEVNVTNPAAVSVVLQAKSKDQQMDQVVVVGYGTQKKVNLTGAVSSITGKTIAERPVSNTALALQGMAPGLSVVNRGGQPGADDVTIRIRGTGTLNSSNPLVLVDGVPQSLSSVAPSEIESISVLKDAASASIYGSRAGNGVILVTTKRGTKEGVSVSYDNSLGWATKSFWPRSAAPGDYLRLHNEAYENAGLPTPYSDEWIKNVEAGTEPLKYPFFDYVPAVFNDDAFQHNHSLSVSSGGKSGKILVALNYLNQEGIVRNHNFERYNIRINADLNITKNLTLSTDLMYRKRNTTGVGRTSVEILQSILNSKQTVVGQYPNGSYDLVGGLRNAIAIINESGSSNKISDDMIGTLGLKYDVVKGLSLKGYVTVNNTASEGRIFRNKLEMNDYYTGEPIPVGALWAQNFLSDSTSRTYEPNYKLYADYTTDLGKNHNIKVLLGYDEIHSNTRYMGGNRNNFYSNDVREIDAGDPKNWVNWGNSSEWKLRSFFGRLNYAFQDKYLFEANLRYDGSSRFSMGKKYGLFPSFSAGWRIDQEDFLKESNVISNLKLRGSWGKLGNQEIPLYRNSAVYSLNQGYNFNNNVVVGAAQTTAANPDISWESTTMSNVGMDLDLYNGKISVVAEYFWRVTNDILFALPIAPSIGIGAPTQNSASVDNKGWELSVNYNGNKGKEFQYTIGFNISDVINKITDLKGTGPYYNDKFNIWQEGYSINTLYGYRTLGLYRTQQDLDTYPKANEQATFGDIIYDDINKDGLINSADRVIIGNMDPRFPIGLNFGATYKGFDFTMFWQGVLKAQSNLDGAIIEGPDWENYTVAEMVTERYHQTKNPNGTMPRVSYGNAWNGYVSDFWMQNTKYLRLKNVQLGYTLPKSITDRIKISKFRVYVSAENLLTFTPTKWVDPEFPAGRLQYYPQSKMKLIGFNIIF